MEKTQFTTRQASWKNDATELMHVRNEVFVQEQNVPAHIESDDYDSVSWYVLAESNDGTAVACARLQPNGKITRIAVRKPWRRQGIAREMLKQILSVAQQNNLQSLYLHAQLSASDLYKEFGFIETGSQFEEAGIQHIKMTRSADTQT